MRRIKLVRLIRSDNHLIELLSNDFGEGLLPLLPGTHLLPLGLLLPVIPHQTVLHSGVALDRGVVTCCSRGFLGLPGALSWGELLFLAFFLLFPLLLFSLDRFVVHSAHIQLLLLL